MTYARGMVGLPILTAISFQAPILILGKVIHEDLLGLYYYAALLAYIPVDLHMRIIVPVLLPAFADKQEDKAALCWGVLQTTRWTALFAVPLVAFMVCCAGEILSLAYGSQYVAVAIPFGILCVQILARNESGVMGGLYLAIGRPDLQRRFAAVRTAVIVASVYPAAVRYGPVGSAAGVLLSGISILLMQTVTARNIIGLQFGRYLRSYLPGMLLSLPVILTVGLLRLFAVDSAWATVTIGAFVLAAAYAVYLGRKLMSGRTLSDRALGSNL